MITSNEQPRLRFARAEDDCGWELRLDGDLIRLFPHRATTQIRILKAFESSGWAGFVRNPLPRDPARYKQNPAQRLRDAVRELNDSLRGQPLRFRCNGNGKTIRLNVIEPATSAPELELAEAGD